MAKIYLKEFSSREEAEIFLQDLIIGRLAVSRRDPIKGLDGMQLTFTTPAKVVTFSDPDGVGLLANQIVEQINEQTGSAGPPAIPRNTARIAAFSSGDFSRLLLVYDGDVLANVAGGSDAIPLLGLPDGGTVGANKCLLSGGVRTIVTFGTKGNNGDTYTIGYQE